MFGRLLLAMREKIRTRAYVVTVHAEEEMANDELSVFDLESCVLSGRIVERQRDTQHDEWKYVIEGFGLDRTPISVAVKLGPTSRLVFITVYTV